MHRIVVINAKGGSGKTTLATNLAACYASRGNHPALLDFDVQGSTMNWLSLRAKNKAPIHGVNACKHDTGMTRSWQMRLPTSVDRVIIDTPSAVNGPDLAEYVRQANIIIIPVLPSPIDIHAVTNFIKDILLLGKMRTIVAANDLNQSSTRIGVVANRVQDNTRVYKPLCQYLASLNVPFVTALRDSHYYTHAFMDGIGVHELQHAPIQPVCKEWQQLLDWIEESPHFPHHPSISSRNRFEQKYNF